MSDPGPPPVRRLFRRCVVSAVPLVPLVPVVPMVPVALVVFTVLAGLAAPAGAAAQPASVGRADGRPATVSFPLRRPAFPQQSDTVSFPPVTPGGAFLRSLAIPGWGQAAAGSYTRAGFYFVTSGATLWMWLKTAHFLDAAEDRRDLLEVELENALIRQGISNPDTLAARVEADPGVTGARSLVEARAQQREDWTSFGIFWLLLNAADAFVSAHLADFPEPVEVDVGAGLPGGGAELRFSVGIGGADR